MRLNNTVNPVSMEASPPHATQNLDAGQMVAESLETWQLNPSKLLSASALAVLNQRSDRAGWQQLTGHLSFLAASGLLWAWSLAQGTLWLAIPVLCLYGFGLATLFAALHECVHRTAFKRRSLNDGVAWLAGVLSFYNSTFYRYYHQWHHRYTRVPGKDPEYEDIAPTQVWIYLWRMSGIPWWVGKLVGHVRMGLGLFTHYPYVPASARAAVRRSTALQMAVYGGAIAFSLLFHHPYVFLYWLLPLAVGQPILRFILIAEHTGCSQDNNPLTNTRTTLTLWPIRFLMWNMPFHAEHHLYPAIPFHALPQAHRQLAEHFAHVSSGYMAANRTILARVGQSA